MKKRLVSLGLCALMMLPCVTLLSSCSDDGEKSTETTLPPLTVTLNMIADGRTTREGVATVQDAINVLTENDLNIHVVLEMYTADTYLEAIEAKMNGLKEAMEAGEKLSSIGSDEDMRRIEIVPGQYRTVTDFPKPYENELDIFVISGYDMLRSLYTAHYDEMYDFNDDLSDTTAALTTKYISENLRRYGMTLRDDGFTEKQVALPGNSYYGQYEYLLINKELFDATPFALVDMTGLGALGDYLEYIGENNPDVTPLYNIGSLGLVTVEGTDSVVASYVPDGTMEDSKSLTPNNILKNTTVKESVISILRAGVSSGKYAKNLKSIDRSLLDDENTHFAAAFIDGNADLPKDESITDRYYVVKTRNPVADQSEIFSSMFAISEYSSDPSRCMALVNKLMTDETLLNTLLYGVENVTYTRDELTNIVQRKYTADPGSDKNAVYIVDEKMVGNTFLAWQNSDMTEEELAVSANNWALAKQASADASYSPFCRFVPETNENLQKYSKILYDLYGEIWEKLPEYNYRINNSTGEKYTYSEFVDYLSSWLALKYEVNFMATSTYNGTDEPLAPYAAQFQKWWQANFATQD